MKNWIIAIGILILIALSQWVETRWDFTENQRFTLTESAKELLQTPEMPLHINFYLDGEMTGSFRALRNEVLQWVKLFHQENKSIEYSIINPVAEGLNLDSLANLGIQGLAVPTESKILRIFPYASFNYNGKTHVISVLNNRKIPVNDRAEQSIAEIPNKFFKALKNVVQTQKPKIGLMVHHDELLPQYLDGFLMAASPYFQFEPLTTPITSGTGELDIEQIPEPDSLAAIISAKPIKPFSDNDKIYLDQYLMKGGNLMFLTENVDAEMDSLFRSDNIVSFPRDNNLDDLLFAYGLRIAPSLIKDLQAAYVTLAIGNVEQNTAYEQFPWVYFPLAISPKNHQINQNLNNPLKFEFANPIEILPRESTHYQILLSTSPYTQLQKPLSYINFSEIDRTIPENYLEETPFPLAVLVSGEIGSAYAGRIVSQQLNNFKSKTQQGKLLLISDGDFIKNHVFRGTPLPLGADKYSLRPDLKSAPNVIYDNANFLINALQYMLGENLNFGFDTDSESYKILNKSLVQNAKNEWRWLSVFIPSIFLSLLFFIIYFYRKKKFS